MNGVVRGCVGAWVRGCVSGQFSKLLYYWSEFIAVAVEGMETQLNCTGSDSPILRSYWSEGPHRSSPDPAEGINQRATPQQSQFIPNYLTVEIDSHQGHQQPSRPSSLSTSFLFLWKLWQGREKSACQRKWGSPTFASFLFFSFQDLGCFDDAPNTQQYSPYLFLSKEGWIQPASDSRDLSQIRQ